MELGYWGIKGVAEPIRWLLAYLGQEYTEYNPTCFEEWFTKRKHNLGLDFPNLPYLIDGNVRISESSAIPFYIAHKAARPDLFGIGWQEQVAHKELEGVLNEYRQALFKLLKPTDDHYGAFEKEFAEEGSMRMKLKHLSGYLNGKKYFLTHLTYVDMCFVYLVEMTAVLAVSCGYYGDVMQQQNLKDLFLHVRSLPNVKERILAAESLPFMPAQPVFQFKMLTSKEAREKVHVKT